MQNHSINWFALFTRLYKWIHSFRFIQEIIATAYNVQGLTSFLTYTNGIRNNPMVHKRSCISIALVSSLSVPT